MRLEFASKARPGILDFAHRLLELDYRLSLFDYIHLPVEPLNFLIDVAI